MRKSVIWRYSNEDFRKIVDDSATMSEILDRVGLARRGGNYKTLKRRFMKDGIDDTRLRTNARKAATENLVRHQQAKALKIKDICVENSTSSTRDVKNKLIQAGALDDTKCDLCDCPNRWNGKILTLQLDHINGNARDNRIHNLRLLCPNCHSQTDTFCGKNTKLCPMCTAKISRPATHCRSCAQKRKSRRKVEWPSASELESMMQTESWRSIGRKYGVSDSAVRKWAKQYDLIR